jgi:CheY-like chemotaxis protein
MKLNGDPLRIGQILTNLCSNAVKFTHQGEIVISTKLLNQTREKVTLEFSVRDTGIGLAQEQIEKLFRSFTQADNSTTRKYGGTGLGLTISKKLVELMHGKIWVESVLGQGSTFFFTIILDRAKDEQDKYLISNIDLKNLKVLVCDDNKTAREILREALESFTFKVTCVESGKAAIEELEKNKENPFELVLMDWKMPEMDGLKTCSIIKSNRNIPKMPLVIMVTAYDKENIFEGANSLGLNGFLVKPISYSVLYDTIIRAFGKTELQKTKREYKSMKKPKDISKIEGISILVVEDNDINQQIATELLESAGFVVEIAGDGREAVKMIEQSGTPSKYSMVFMDLQMPVMDGFIATQEIRKNSNYTTLPIVAMTADAMSGVKEKCLEAGMMDFVTKPIDPEEVFNVLLKWTKIKEGGVKDTKLKTLQKDEEINLPKFLYININEGLLRVNNNKKLYSKLLKSFFTTFTNFEKEIKTLFSEGKMKDAERVAHTLKGVSGNIGAKDVCEAAAGLERKFKNAEVLDIDKELSPVTERLILVLKELESFSESKEEVSPIDKFEFMDFEKLDNLLDELLTLLKDDDYDAQNKMDLILALPGIRKFDTEVKTISKKIADYDFEEAIKIILNFKIQITNTNK